MDIEYLRRIASGEIEIADAATRRNARDVYRVLAEGVSLSPALGARTFRALREPPPTHPDDLADVAAKRTMLHEQAAAGNELAAEILALLDDDPFWADEGP